MPWYNRCARIAERPPGESNPMTNPTELRQTIEHLLLSQGLAVLATQEAGQPYASLVTVAAAPDLTYLLFPTLRNTRKYAHLEASCRVALLLDNRLSEPYDSPNAMALTVIGTASEAPADEQEQLSRWYLEQHPHLQSFVRDPDCALIKVQVERYRLVRRLQYLAELDMGSTSG